MYCQECNSQLKLMRYQEIEIDRYSGCGGLWFDVFEHEEVRELKGSEVLDSHPRIAVAATSGSGLCPKDKQPLLAMAVAVRPHIGYESCGLRHGVLFDAGEFKDFRKTTLSEWLRAEFSTAPAVQSAG